MCKRIALFFFVVLMLVRVARAQTYNFAHYDIDNGLVQSQVLTIYQDDDHYLWFGSLGGLSRFDGKEFRSYSKSDGLSRSMVLTILHDDKGVTWVGSDNGVSGLMSDKVTNIRPPAVAANKLVRNLSADRGGNTWMTINFRLYRLHSGKIIPASVIAGDEFVTALRADVNGNLYAAVYGKGIYRYNGRTWEQLVPIGDKLNISRIVFDVKNPAKLYLLSSDTIYQADSHGISSYRNPALDGADQFTALEQDADGNLWVGTMSGAWWLKHDGAVRFTGANGLSSYPVNDIFKDAEDNIWIGTNGAGVFRFDGGAVINYRTVNGQTLQVMSMAPGLGRDIWMGTTANTVVHYDDGQFRVIPLPKESPYGRTVLSLNRGPDNAIYAGMLDGLWKYNGTGFNDVLRKQQYPKTVRCQLTTRDGTHWIGAPKGCFYRRNGVAVPVAGLESSVDAMAEGGRDSVFAATNKGIFLVRGKQLDRSFRIAGVENSTFMNLLYYKGCLLAGTFGDGLYVIDVHTRKMRRATTKHGFYSNDIYSLATDDHGYLWAGTGKGVNRFVINPQTLAVGMRTRDVLPYVLFECNQNAMVNVAGKIWVGTTKGIYVFDTKLNDRARKRPSINIQSVSVVSQAPGAETRIQAYDEEIPDTLNLDHRQNRIIISFMGIYMTEPDDVSYQYRLRGQGEQFSPPVKTNMIEFSVLPGTYTFEIKAVTASGASSATRAVTFIITPPFYQTTFFRVFITLLVIALVVVIQYYWNYVKAQRKRVLAQIKVEEQQRIRRETAEDFHDDIGNKLTRIAVLSDMLNRYIPGEQTEQRDLVNQIKSNADTLYRGTKDILWSLDPQSDNIAEILAYTCRLGNELFSPNNIVFDCKTNGSRQERKLPMKYSRNISMLLKECFHNILKHAQAQHVTLEAKSDKDGLSIMVADDGRGFDVAAPASGRGVNNMRTRARRLNAGLEIDSAPGKGTTLRLFIPLQADYNDLLNH